MATYYTPKITIDGLVLCLDAANPKSYIGSGTSWVDLSGNSGTGTLTNGPVFNSSNTGVIQFDGVNDYISGVNNSTVSTTGDMTEEAWFYVTSTPSDWVRVFGKGDTTNRTYGLWINVGSALFLYQRYGGSSINIQASRTVSLNTWYHMVGTSSGTSHVLYLNGVSIANGSGGSTFYSSTDPYTVGYAGFHTYIPGYVASAKLYNRALSASEVLQNYNATRTRYGI